MKITKRQLRRLIYECMVVESLSKKEREKAYTEYERKKKEPIGRHGANVTNIVNAKPTINDWADVLLDELVDEIPQIANILPEKKSRVTDEITAGVVSSLIKALGFWAPRGQVG